MKIVVCILAALLAGLSLFAAITQLKSSVRKTPHLLMSFGSVTLIGAIICCAMSAPLDWLFALLGGVLICGAAIMNGKLSGNFHWQHHVIRGVITLVIIVGFALL